MNMSNEFYIYPDGRNSMQKDDVTRRYIQGTVVDPSLDYEAN